MTWAPLAGRFLVNWWSTAIRLRQANSALPRVKSDKPFPPFVTLHQVVTEQARLSIGEVEAIDPALDTGPQRIVANNARVGVDGNNLCGFVRSFFSFLGSPMRPLPMAFFLRTFATMGLSLIPIRLTAVIL
jgi:hypothetical protein